MSTELQLKGDSRRRQLEASRAYAEANSLELAEGAELEDIGYPPSRAQTFARAHLANSLRPSKQARSSPGPI
jgi:hypothetical protein